MAVPQRHHPFTRKLAEFGDTSVVYTAAFENIDIEYQLTARGIKAFFVLHARPQPPVGHLLDPILDFTQTIAAGALIIYVDGAPAPDKFTTDQSIEFVDEVEGEADYRLSSNLENSANSRPLDGERLGRG